MATSSKRPRSPDPLPRNERGGDAERGAPRGRQADLRRPAQRPAPGERCRSPCWRSNAARCGWIDSAMVRRETGSDTGVHVMFGGRPRALAEAHVLQRRAPPQRRPCRSSSRAACRRSSPPRSILDAAAGWTSCPLRRCSRTSSVSVSSISRRRSTSTSPSCRSTRSAQRWSRIAVAAADRPRGQGRGSRRHRRADPGAGDAPAVPAFRQCAAGHHHRHHARPRHLARANRLRPARAADRQAPQDDRSRAATSRRPRRRKPRRSGSGPGDAAYQEALGALPMVGGRPPLLWYTRRRSIAYQTRVAGVGVAVSGDDVAIRPSRREPVAAEARRGWPTSTAPRRRRPRPGSSRCWARRLSPDPTS